MESMKAKRLDHFQTGIFAELNELKEQVNKFINSMPLDNNRDKSKKD